MTNQHVDGFHTALSDWVDQRFITREQLQALAMFSLYIVNILDARGFSYYGHSYTQKGRMGCLVLKADREGTPYVVFTNSWTYTGSVIILLRRLQEDAVDWRADRYRT